MPVIYSTTTLKIAKDTVLIPNGLFLYLANT